MNIKILKLRSGEEIACQVLEETDNTIKIFQPMLFKTTQTVDFKGRLIDVTSLHDWLLNSDDKNINLPSNHVAFITEPNKDTLNLYTIESKKEFSKKETIKTEDETLDSSSDHVFDMLTELLNSSGNLMDDLFPLPPKSKTNKRKKKIKKSSIPPDMIDEKELDQHMIMMQLYIPAESIMNLITAGIIDPQVLLKMIEEVKKRNRFTGDEKDKKTFGNEFSDWNPDPKSKDYQ